MDGNHNHDAASAPRATGGQVSQPVGRMLRAPESYRRDALDCAIKAGGSSRAEHIVSLAMAFEAYLKDGTPASKPIPAPVQPPLPLSFADAAAVASSDCLYAIERVLRERARQVAKGYDAKHDDAHITEMMADQAASAIVSASSFVEGGPPFKRWIDYGQDRATVLVQGIALALAELERVHRANDRANLAEAPPAVRPGLKTARGLDQSARSIYAPIGELQGKAVNAIISDGLDDAPRAEPMTLEELAAACPVPKVQAEEVVREVEPMGLDDFDKMHHAIGRPRDVMAETHRNHYATAGNGTNAARFRDFPTFWEAPGTSAVSFTLPKMVYFSITEAGRAALATAIAKDERFFRFEIENAAKPIKGE